LTNTVEAFEYEGENHEQTIRREDVVDNKNLFRFGYNTDNAFRAHVIKGLIGEMTVWAALQKICNIDLLHAYISRNDILVIIN